MKKVSSIAAVSICCLLLFISCGNSTTDKKKEENPDQLEEVTEEIAGLSVFKVSITKKKESIEVGCLESCEFKKSSTITEVNKEVLFTQKGSSTPQYKDDGSIILPEDAEFAFILIKSNKGVDLYGFQGIAWTHLSFTLADGQMQNVDQNGMVD